MGRTVVVEYKCDMCGKVQHVDQKLDERRERPFKEISIPAKRYDCEGRNFSYGMTEVDMCEECFLKYSQYVAQRYDVSLVLGSVEVQVKDDEK